MTSARRAPAPLPAILGAALAATLLAGPAAAQFVAPEGSNFHNGSTLPLLDEGEAREQLHQLQGALDRHDGAEAASILRVLRADPRALLVPQGPRTDRPAIEMAALLIARADDATRRRVEGDALQAIAAARATRDLDVLIDHATRGGALESAREAGLLAARLLCEQGEFWQAASLALRAGDLPGAADVLAAARAGAARLAPPAMPPDAAPAGADEPPVADPLGHGWVLQSVSRLRQEVDTESAGLPLIADGRPGEVVILDGRGIVLMDTRTGTASAPPFPWTSNVPQRFDGELLAPAPRRHTLARAGDRLIIPFEIPSSRPRSPRESRRALLLAVDLLPQVAPQPAAPATPGAAAPPLPDGLRMAWVADLPARTASDPAPAPPGPDVGFFDTPEEPSITFGPPLVAGPRVFVQVFRTGLTTEVSLACFALADGRLLFETPLVAGSQVQRFNSRLAEMSVRELDKRAREGPPAERDGIVWACTGFGVVAAVDGLTGLPLHTFRYDRLFSLDPDTYDPAFLFDTGGWDDEPVRLWGDRIVVAPGDSRFLYMLAGEPGPRGDQILDDPIERLDRRFIVDLLPDPRGDDSPAVLASRRRGRRDGLVLLGPDGHTLAASPLLPAGQSVTGRPALAGPPSAPRVLLPTSTGLIEIPRDDIAAAPQPLPHHDMAPAEVVAVFPLREGAATISSLPPTSALQPPWWLIQCYRWEP